MAQDSEKEMRSEYINLAKSARSNKVDKVLASCDIILEAKPDDEVVKEVKAIALARKGKFAQAETWAAEGSGIKAYCAYRLGRIEEAVPVDRKDDVLGAHVSAQAKFRLGKYAEAAEKYQALLKECRPAEKLEVMVNYFAASCESLHHIPKVLSSLEENLKAASPNRHQELYFNAALLLFKAGEPRLAMAYAEAAKSPSQSTSYQFEALIAACEAMLGDGESAKFKCIQLQSQGSIKDKPALSFCTLNTLFAARAPGENIFDSHKRLKPLLSEVSTKQHGQQQQQQQHQAAALHNTKKKVNPTPSQRFALSFNWARLLYDMGKGAESAEWLRSHILTSNDPQVPAEIMTDAIILAALGEKRAKTMSILQRIEEVYTKEKTNPKIDQVRLAAAVAEARLEEHNDDMGAIDILTTISADQSPGIVSVKSTLLEAAGQKDTALNVLNELDAIYAQNDRNNRRLLASHYLCLGQPEASLKALPARSSPDDALPAAICATYFDIEQARTQILSDSGHEKAAAILDAYDHPTSDLTDEAVEAILAKPLPQKISNTHTNGTLVDQVIIDQTASKRRSEAAILRRRAKKRQAYLAQLIEQGKYDPQKPTAPDPERWLPKKLRSSNKYNRSKGYRKNAAGNKISGAQGVEINAKELAKLDVAARTANASSADNASLPPGAANRKNHRRRPASKK